MNEQDAVMYSECLQCTAGLLSSNFGEFGGDAWESKF